MNLIRTTAAAVLAASVLAVPTTAGADPKPKGGKFGEPYSLGDCGGFTLEHINHNSPVIHDPDGTTVWVFREVTYSDGTTTETFRIGKGVSDGRLATCTDSYVDDGVTISFTAKLQPSGQGRAK